MRCSIWDKPFFCPFPISRTTAFEQAHYENRVAAHYSISVSGPVRDRKGTHVHTFLVNDTTGEVWRMDCGGPSGIQFVRVTVQGLESPSQKNLQK